MRTVSGMMLAAAFALVLGCGKSDPPADTKATPSGDPASPQGAPNTPPTPPAPAVAAWEMDPAKHAFTGPATGRVLGTPTGFDIQAERDVLRFRAVNKDGVPVGNAFEIHLADPMLSMEGLNLTVKPDQPEGLGVPTVIVYDPGAPLVEPKIIKKGYALTLSLGKREKGKLSGRAYLSIADEKQSFVAGSFTADWIRPATELPGPDDAPFIQGKITINGVSDPNVWVGYVRVEPSDVAGVPSIDLVGTDLKPAAPHVRSDGNRPRMALLVPGAGGSKDPARFEFTKLEPGRYWVFATVKGGPAMWKWLTVEPNGQVNSDFTIDAATFGGVEVTVATAVESISVVPAGDKPWPEALIVTAASLVDLRVETAGSKPDAGKPLSVKFPRLAPGKYEIWAGDLTATVEVKVNETAKVELKKK